MIPGTSATDLAELPGPRSGSRATRPDSRRRTFPRIVVGALIVLSGLAGGFYLFERGGPKPADHQGKGPVERHSAVGIPVEATTPRPGGIERKTTQAGSVHAFEHASLYSKVSGFLKVQNVDIGDRVKQGQVLAVIDDPEVDEAVQQNVASLAQSKARVAVAQESVKSAEAEKGAAEAMVTQAEADIVAKVSNRELQDKQLKRIASLVARGAVEDKLEDEQKDRFDVATADLGFARAVVLSAKAVVLSKAALIGKAKADLDEARANVEIAEANLAKARVMQDYTRITSPYDGVVTLRSFHRGDFVRSASEGGDVPLLAVARTDKMRVVLPIPDTDVPYVDQGDPAVLRMDALPGMAFQGVVSRYSESEDSSSRNMRTEVDLPNPDGKLREGMYGRVTVILQPAAKDAVTIPSSALIDQTGTGQGNVFVIRDGKSRRVAVQVTKDNGVDAEIVNGLTVDDHVIVSYNGTVADGTPVKPVASKAATATGH